MKKSLSRTLFSLPVLGYCNNMEVQDGGRETAAFVDIKGPF